MVGISTAVAVAYAFFPHSLASAPPYLSSHTHSLASIPRALAFYAPVSDVSAEC